jgi:hypothetical protein
MPKFDWDVYRDQVLNLKRTRRLHPEVLSRLGTLLKIAFPDATAVPEVSATLGGRNDLIQFFHDGRRTVFEVFASESQVPQDLRLLEQCEANAKIAILIESTVDSRVSTEFFRKRPNHFPYLWLRVILEPQWQNATVSLLRELTDDNRNIQRVRRLLASPYGPLFDDALRKIIDRLEQRIPRRDGDSPTTPLNGYQRGALLVIAAIRDLGVPIDKLRALYAWLADAIEFAFEIAACGAHPFLITDLKGRNAIWSSGDIADCLFLAPAEKEAAEILVDLHPVINRIREAYGFEKREVSWTFFHTYAEQIGKIIPAWEMKKGQEDQDNCPDQQET